MNQTISFFILVLSIFGFVGCSSELIKRNETINELIISNHTTTDLSEVALRVPRTGMMVACNVILRSTDCSLGFPELENEREYATLSWIERGKKYTRDIISEIPDDLDQNKPAKVFITIETNGQMSSRIGQD